MERRAAGGERNGVLRLLSLELTFADERCAEALSDQRFLGAMARFEKELAIAAAGAGLVPVAHAQTIASVCDRASFDAAALARAAREAGTLAIPFVDALRKQVGAASAEAAQHVHAGATSQDVIDTAAALCLKAGSGRVLELARRLGDAASRLAERHAGTPTLARTLLQPALPVPFGWKAAVWLSLIARSYANFRRAVEEGCALQLGGPSGTLPAFADKGPAVVAAMASALSLGAPRISWHSARDGFARIGAETAILAGAAAKVGRDVALLMQAEVAEAAEPKRAGRGGSSSMAHKRNPALSMLALEAAQRSPGLVATLLGELSPEHERGLGQWQNQWRTLRELLLAASSGIGAVAEVLEGLEIDEAAMRANLQRLAPPGAHGDGAAGTMIKQALAMWRETAP